MSELRGKEDLLNRLVDEMGMGKLIEALRIIALKRVAPKTNWDLWYTNLGAALDNATIETMRRLANDLERERKPKGNP